MDGIHLSRDQLLELIQKGEDSQTQFKVKITGADALAAEISAFANTQGGLMIVGVSNNGNPEGLTREKVDQYNQLISNVCAQKIDPPLSVWTQIIMVEDRRILVIQVPRGPNKFYLANGRAVWVKLGADKRRASREEMRRLLQESSNLFADEQPIFNTSFRDLDSELLDSFLSRKLSLPLDSDQNKVIGWLNHMKLMKEDQCTLAGLLLLGKRHTQPLASFPVSCVSWYGTEITGKEYRESEELNGSISYLYSHAISFLKRQLRKLQKGQDFNSVGILEIPEEAIQEALMNAILHRNYFLQSNIRIFVLDDRVEMISPGSLPNTLTVESIKTGVHIARNPILLSHIKDLPGIPYRGIGTGIIRIMKSCQLEGISVDFDDDPLTNQFRIVFHRSI